MRKQPEVILVLGSGSSRGFAHAGVLKVLEENHIPIDMIVGTSAGSIVGALYADHPSASSLQQLIMNTSRDQVMDFSLMNIRTGVVSGNQLQNFLIQHMRAKSFEQLTIPFVAVAADLDSGKIHVFGSGPIAPAVNASSAVPPFFRPVQLYGKTYIDGGMIDPVAVDVAQWFHPKMIIAVNLDSPLSSSLPTSTPGIFLRGVDMMMSQLNEYSASQADVVIHPKLFETDMFDGSTRKDLMQSGAVAAQNALPEIKRLLKENNIALR
jgi:NTE family protein